MTKLWLAIFGASMICQAHAQSALPPPSTPGALNPAVTQDTVNQTICVKGWTKTIRPPAAWTSALKRRQLRELGYPEQHMRAYEEDHRLPLELGGAPEDERNLWPEPWFGVDGWTADRKDELENTLNHLVCSHRIPLSEAQAAFLGDWTQAYKRYVR